jgi:DNA-binding NarL/FixJ family response regulator
MSAVSERAGVCRVYLIEPQGFVAKGLCRLLSGEHSLEVVGDSPDLELDHVVEAAPDLILLDGDYDQNTMTVALKTLKSDRRVVAKVCVLSMYLHADRAMRAISAGADGYVVKDVAPHELFASLAALMRDGMYVDPRLSGLLLRRRLDRTWTDIERLSPREIDIVRLIAQGLSNKEISRALTLSDKTVKNHISNIFSKLNCTARTQVAIHAIRHGLA